MFTEVWFGQLRSIVEGGGSKGLSGPFPASEESGDAVVTELGFVPRAREKKIWQ